MRHLKSKWVFSLILVMGILEFSKVYLYGSSAEYRSTSVLLSHSDSGDEEEEIKDSTFKRRLGLLTLKLAQRGGFLYLENKIYDNVKNLHRCFSGDVGFLSLHEIQSFVVITLFLQSPAAHGDVSLFFKDTRGCSRSMSIIFDALSFVLVLGAQVIPFYLYKEVSYENQDCSKLITEGNTLAPMVLGLSFLGIFISYGQQRLYSSSS